MDNIINLIILAVILVISTSFAFAGFSTFNIRKQLKYMSFEGTHTFLVQKKWRRYSSRHHRTTRCFELVSADGRYKMDYFPEAEEYEKYNKNDTYGEPKDVYVSSENKKHYKVIDHGQQFDDSGKEELFLGGIYFVMALLILFMGYIGISL